MTKRIIGILFIVIAIFAIYVFAIKAERIGILQLIGLFVFVSILLFQAKSYLIRDKIIVNKEKPSKTLDAVCREKSPFDAHKRRALVAKLKSMNEPLLISINEFFDGNYSDIGSIGCNIYPVHPTIPVFAEAFQKLLDRNDVDSIYAQISEIEPDDDSWPYTDKVYIYGSITMKDIEELTKQLEPTEIGNGRDFLSTVPKSIKNLNNESFHVLWWD